MSCSLTSTSKLRHTQSHICTLIKAYKYIHPINECSIFLNLNTLESMVSTWKSTGHYEPHLLLKIQFAPVQSKRVGGLKCLHSRT